MIKAPYNFVPLSKKVFFPSWADQISQDIPFSDGEDGSIILTIKNLSPLFVRDGHTKEESTEWSCHILDGTKKKYFIPATTLKGCFRSVLEILSFSKMNRYNDDFFGYRSFTTQVSKEYSKIMNKAKFCGWLYNYNGTFYIEECKEGIQKISHVALKKVFPNFTIGEDHKTAEIKQMSIKNGDELFPAIEVKAYGKQGKYVAISKNDNNEVFIFTFDEEISTDSNPKVIFDKSTKYIHYGKYKVVCTGFMGGDPGKSVEYLFSDETKPAKEVSDDVIKRFKTVHKYTPYFIGEKRQKGFLQKILSSGGKIPVFFEKNNGQVSNIGITRMFRYPYNYSVKDQVIKAQEKCEDGHLDLPEAIFGNINTDNQLRGRVQFGHAFCQNTIQDGECQLCKGVFGQPRASYFPLYLQQATNRVLTYDSNIPIAGRKRYRIVSGHQTIQLSQGNDNELTMSSFRPLPANKTFVCKINLHNLRTVEIGALLSAITFHGNNSQNVYHNLGLAKAYGYGCISCSNIELIGLKYSVVEYLKAIEDEIVSYIRNEYSDENFCMQEDETIQMLVKIAESTHLKEDMGHMALGEFEQYKESRNFSQLKEPSAIRLRNMDEVKSAYDKQVANSLVGELRGMPSPKGIENTDVIKEQIAKWEAVKDTLEQNNMPTSEVDSYLTQLKERLYVIENPTSYKVGDIVKAKCIAPKKVRLDEYDYDIQLVIPKWEANQIVGKSINAIIKQISKAGKIVQLEYIE